MISRRKYLFQIGHKKEKIKSSAKKHKLTQLQTDVTVKGKSKPICYLEPSGECSICCENKPYNKLNFIDCCKGGIYTINIGRRTTLRHPICNECMIRCNDFCPFCRSHGFVDLLKYNNKKSFRKKKLPWHIRKIKSSIKKKMKELKRLRKERAFFKKNMNSILKYTQFYSYCKNERRYLLLKINIILNEIDNLDNKICNIL